MKQPENTSETVLSNFATGANIWVFHLAESDRNNNLRQEMCIAFWDLKWKKFWVEAQLYGQVSKWDKKAQASQKVMSRDLLALDHYDGRGQTTPHSLLAHHHNPSHKLNDTTQSSTPRKEYSAYMIMFRRIIGFSWSVTRLK